MLSVVEKRTPTPISDRISVRNHKRFMAMVPKLLSLTKVPKPDHASTVVKPVKKPRQDDEVACWCDDVIVL